MCEATRADAGAILAKWNTITIEVKAAELFEDSNVIGSSPTQRRRWEDPVTKEGPAERTVHATVHARRTLQAGSLTARTNPHWLYSRRSASPSTLSTLCNDLGTEEVGDAESWRRGRCSRDPPPPSPVHDTSANRDHRIKWELWYSPYLPSRAYMAYSRIHIDLSFALCLSVAVGPKNTMFPKIEGINEITITEVANGLEEGNQVDGRYRPTVLPSRWPCIPQDVATVTSSPELKGLRGVPTSCGPGPITVVALMMHAPDPSTGAGGSPKRSYRVGTNPGGVGKVRCGRAWRARSSLRWAMALTDDNFACGGDTGVFAHWDNALELWLMTALGARPAQVLQWATLGGWRRTNYMEMHVLLTTTMSIRRAKDFAAAAS
ncbi:hypothetical protein BJY52DRAFT_1225236 [Lactarius psammicola]|nr:hypothetical protein BJY52DRAFT_1225236 [Lactarius psammicola]